MTIKNKCIDGRALGCEGAASLQAQWQGLQESAERVIVRVLAGQSSSFLSQVEPTARPIIPWAFQCRRMPAGCPVLPFQI